MLNLKKTAVAVLAFGSSAVFAGTMGPVCSAVNVTVPCESTAWDVGVKALYLKPSYSNTGSFVGAAQDVLGNQTYVSGNPSWAWGFMLEGSYHFHTGNDLNLNWYHLGSNSTTTTYTGFYQTPAMFIRGIQGNAVPQSASRSPNWDAVNLEFGQHVDFGDSKNIRFHGGVQYARIRTTNSVTATAPNFGALTPATFVGTTSGTATYNGFGPRLGTDASYDFGNGMSMFGNVATSLLVGTSKASVTYVNNTTGATAIANTATNLSKVVIVPELEAKLGGAYTFAMAQGDLTLDAGWMWVNYFNAQTAVANFNTSDSDFGVQGPFIGLKWVGNAA